MSDQIVNGQSKHTDEIQNIIGAPPSWLLNWGITIFLGILIFVLCISEVIQYPDVIKTELRIRSLNLDSPVDIKSSGKLLKFLVQNNQVIRKNQALVIIENDSRQVILKSPQDGIITYEGILHEKQELLPAQTILHIHNIQKDFFGELSVPYYNVGKIRIGQQVLVKLRNFPFQEYGMIHGTIKYITDDPIVKNGYLAEVDFEKNNLTDMNKSLNLKQGMDADAEIIIQNRSLLKRLTDNAFKNITN